MIRDVPNDPTSYTQTGNNFIIQMLVLEPRVHSVTILNNGPKLVLKITNNGQTQVASCTYEIKSTTFCVFVHKSVCQTCELINNNVVPLIDLTLNVSSFINKQIVFYFQYDLDMSIFTTMS